MILIEVSLPDTPIRCKDHHHRTRGQDISIKKKKKTMFCSTSLQRKIGQDREDRAVGGSSEVRGRVSGKEMREGAESYQV